MTNSEPFLVRNRCGHPIHAGEKVSLGAISPHTGQRVHVIGVWSEDGFHGTDQGAVGWATTDFKAGDLGYVKYG